MSITKINFKKSYPHLKRSKNKFYDVSNFTNPSPCEASLLTFKKGDFVSYSI